MEKQFIGQVSQDTIYGHQYTNLIDENSLCKYHECGKDIHDFLEEFHGKTVKITIELV